MNKEIKLNLGCGDKILEGWENYDKTPSDPRVKNIDLNKLPLPFKDNYADYILLSHVYEHLDVNHFEFMREIHRVLKVGGIVEIRVPSCKVSVEHTKHVFLSKYFDNICRFENRKENKYIDFLFEKVSFERVYRDKYGFLFDVFPFMEKLFPFMQNVEMIWKLKKIV